MNLLLFSRRSDRPGRRPQVRRPLVEGLECRQLLSGLVGDHGPYDGIIGRHIGTSVAEVQKDRDAAATVQAGHLGGGVVNIIAIL